MAEKTTEKVLITENSKLELHFPWETVAPAYNAAVSKLSRTLKVDGFRSGKVPKDVAEKMLNPESIVEESLQSVLPAVYAAELEKSKKQPLGRPSFSIQKAEKNGEWIVIAEIAEKPELSITGYEKIVKKTRIEAENTFTKLDKKEGETVEDTAQRKRTFVLEEVYKAVLAEYQPSAPELLVRQEVDHDAQDLLKQLKTFHFTLAQYLERRQITEQQLSQELAATALGRLQLLFFIDAVAAQIKLEVTDAEIDAYIEKEVSPEIKERFHKDQQYRALIGQTLVRQKVAEHLLAL